MSLLCIFAIFVPSLTAQVATAGAVIGNQATATYNDAAGVQRQAFSNLVQTTVTQIYSGTLSSTQARYATIGTQVVFPHTYTNTGNGSDTVTLSLGVASANFTNPAIYMDANGDGIPDNTTPISGPFTLAPGQVLKVVLVGTLGTGAAVGTAETDTLKAVSGGGGVVTGTPNTDTINPTKNAAIAVTKAMSASSGVGGNTVGVTLTYTNTGNTTATAVVIADPLGSTGVQATSNTFVYVAASGKLNGVALTDNAGGWVTTGNSTQYTVASVAPGVTGTITFNVTVGALATIGGTINNTANFAYNDGVSAIAAMNTNTVPFTIQQSAAVAWTAGDAGDFTAGNPATDALGAQTVNQGGTIMWTDTLTNQGNGFDTFNITYNGSTFPAGTTFQFFRADGLTPLTDSNGDGIIDVGPIAAGGTATIKVKALLPPGTSETAAALLVNVVATSTASTAINFATATATDQDKVTLTTTVSAVDLTTVAPANGAGPVGKGSGVTSALAPAVNPGAQTIIPFYVQNTSLQSAVTAADAYSLSVQSYSTNANVTVPVAGTALPAGWSVIIHQASGASCPAAYAAQSTPVTSTPALTAANGANAASSYQLYCVEVDVPANSVAVTNDFIITALSNASGAEDQMTFAVTINTLHLVTITPNQSGQIYAGGTIVYKHIITDAGNSNETVTFPAAAPVDVVFTPALSGWTGTVYLDSDASGALDSSDAVVIPGTTTIALTPGQSAVVFLKIQAAPSANPGDNTDTTFTVQYQGATFSAKADDVTTVITGQVKLVKQQSVITHTGVSTCAVVAGAYSTGGLNAGSKDCIFYQIVATNTGTTSVTVPSVTDTAPPFTTPYAGFNGGKPLFSNTCSLTDPTPAFAGSQFTGTYAAGSMTAGCTITAVFEVQLN
jgi:hypothetical protein